MRRVIVASLIGISLEWYDFFIRRGVHRAAGRRGGVRLRFLQGLGLGGEWGGAVLMTLESGPAERRGLNASWPQVGVPIGLLLANGCCH